MSSFGSNDGTAGLSGSSTGSGDSSDSGDSGGSSDSGDSSTGSAADEEYYKTIRVLGYQVNGAEAHEDFPLFVSLIDSDLHDRAQVDGCDIAFYQGSTLLDFELEQFDAGYTATEARVAAWVRIPSLSATGDTEIRLHYGLPCGSYEDRGGVWGGGYELVWHMNSSADSEILDSSVNGFDGTLHGGPTIEEGKLGKSLVLDGINDRIEGPHASELGIHGSAARTFSVWANIQNYDATPWGGIFGIGWMGGGCCLYNGYGISRGSDTVSFSVGGEWTQNANWVIFDDGAGFDEWIHYVAVYDGALGLEIYANGQRVEEATLDQPLDTLDTNPLLLPYSDNYFIGGPRDEMRVSKRVLSAHWIATEYSNQNDPGSFYEVGPETVVVAP